ncbi:hypothetical protein HYPSUDRAFT_58081 [Hypholoma sublateritium FD-334 SS-4]|uniref:Uncharacterized protein n=1 Tax=Hypholoma sublateritium (strain FD-334 SS-4) TaxID=945553 RepID=A0A0D2M0K1_HYPSF|nr:hypothetical protein HYPSUDRAFT_58081 [Hypholoma sublateritium FD-334 SS-4]
MTCIIRIFDIESDIEKHLPDPRIGLSYFSSVTMQSQFDCRSSAHIRRSSFSILGGSIYALGFSRTAKYLAIGNDEGQLEFRKAGDGWDTMRIYDANSQIRAIQWDPTNENRLYMGMENGNIYSIEINPDGENDIVCYDQVPGYVHAIAVCENGSGGSTLVIAYGQNIGFIRDPFASNDYLGSLTLFPVEPYPNTQDISSSPFVRAVQFLDADTIVVTYLGVVGVKVLKLSSCEKVQDLTPPTQFEFYGSAALSPSGRRLAVTNHGLGIDWYSFCHDRFMSTSHYSTQGRNAESMITGLTFIDEDTVVVGHCAGSLVFVTFGMSHNPFILPIGTTPIQTLAYAKFENDDDPIVLAILQGKNVPTTVVIVDIQLTIVHLNAQYGSTPLLGMPGALGNKSPVILNASPGLSSFNIKLTVAVVVLAVAVYIAQLRNYNYMEVVPRIRLGCLPWKSDCEVQVHNNMKTVYATTTVTARRPSRTEMITTTVTETSTFRGYTTTHRHRFSFAYRMPLRNYYTINSKRD